jgi:hypothetical protein
MAVKKRASPHKHYTGNKKGGAAELSARLAPLEEHAAGHAADSSARTDDDTIVLDTEKLKLPHALMEEEGAPAHMLGLEPVILVILLIALAFIAFIAYLISQTPAPAAQ